MIIFDFDELGSTNDMARQLLENGNCAPFWVISNKQTSGRGRRGKIWQSINGNLFTSGIYEFDNEIKNLPILSFVAAIALKRCFANLIDNKNIFLKWPNDIFINEKKISGILLEHHRYNNKSYVIFGIGVNLVYSPKNIDQETTCLFENIFDVGKMPNNKEFLNFLIEQFNAVLFEFNAYGFEKIRHEWLSNAYKIGKEISAKIGEKEITGIFETINELGELIIIDKDKTKHIVNSGEVFFR